MIVIERAQLKFLLRGRTLTIATTRQYHKGRTYAVSTRGRRHAICRAQIIDLGLDSIRIRIAATPEQPRLLARNPIAQKADYVDQLGRAMWDEPEAVDQATQDRLTELGTIRWQQLNQIRASEAMMMGLRARVQRLERVHAWGHTDLTSELRLLRQQIRERQERTI